jgi:hypothetical protein
VNYVAWRLHLLLQAQECAFATTSACALLLLRLLLLFQRLQPQKLASYVHVSESSLQAALIATQIQGIAKPFQDIVLCNSSIKSGFEAGRNSSLVM